MQNAIDRTNSFYLEMSEKALPEKEYGLLHKLITEKTPLQEAAAQYAITSEYVEILYESTLSKVKVVTELLSEINEYMEKLQELKQELNPSAAQIREKKTKNDREKLVCDSQYALSRRLLSVLDALEIETFGQMADFPLKDFLRIRGFRTKCKEELIALIEFEKMQYLFKGFARWKKEPIPQFK
ncbi:MULTISPECIES: hypothetical protein [unclassified Flavobacterium]|uniref:hypothetical protein n=1 Tax=unclassified Flavobacterium TaxID=196869 RepID=UPI0006AB9E0C|nr:MULTISPECIES: hypothetical protein [unclassified Flavobacterium]KOP38892.1 hypothetical protein AKO67_07675 [Flavobacterium sp. VMW]OWU92843.1 hypothetical protein APR43_01940 [Flavobacterium sp. NLM]